MPAPIAQLKALDRRTIARTGCSLVRYRTERGGVGDGSDPAVASAPDMEPEFRELHARCALFTMTPPARMHNLYIAMRHVLDRRISGDIVECGVWRGGSAMLCAMMLARAGEREGSRRGWLDNTFVGMAGRTDKDRSFEGVNTHDIWAASQRGRAGEAGSINPWCDAPLEDVGANMLSPGLSADRIAPLRPATAWYEANRAELARRDPRLGPGSVLLVDDFGQWLGQRQAVDEYFADRGPAQRPLLARIDQSSRMGNKPAG